MISKPENYEKIPVGGEAIKAGGHKCRIMQAEESMSQRGSQMLVISFDTTEDDPQPNYYMARWVNDKRDKDEKKWGGKMYIVTEGEYGPANLKRFCTAVEDSNEGFSCWKGNSLDLAGLKNKLVGVVFREEEYRLDDGQCRWSCKGTRFCNYEKAFEQKIPDPKPLPDSGASFQPAPMPTAAADGPDYGFVNVADGLEDEGLPFK